MDVFTVLEWVGYGVVSVGVAMIAGVAIAGGISLYHYVKGE